MCQSSDKGEFGGRLFVLHKKCDCRTLREEKNHKSQMEKVNTSSNNHC